MAFIKMKQWLQRPLRAVELVDPGAAGQIEVEGITIVEEGFAARRSQGPAENQGDERSAVSDEVEDRVQGLAVDRPVMRSAVRKSGTSSV